MGADYVNERFIVSNIILFILNAIYTPHFFIPNFFISLMWKFFVFHFG